MKSKFTFLLLLLSGYVWSQSTDYTKGVFIVNEDWFGHRNSTLNFISDKGDWSYDVYKKENPGKELGATSQYGTIYGGKFYIVSKQEIDGGASIVGSRLAVCDPLTMKSLKEFTTIGGADGRAFLGVDEKTGYISTSNGIWLYDIEGMKIGTQIAGTENIHTDPYGKLYKGQSGTMLRVGDRVFAMHQDNGIIVINANTHQVETTITGAYGSITQSKDGNLWVSVAADHGGMGGTKPELVKLNPYTLETKTLNIPSTISAIPNSWYAWTADGFCSSAKENKIYWKEDGGWFAATKIFYYDIDNNEFGEVYNWGGTAWQLYGAAFRIHPVTDEIYAFLYQGFGSQSYSLGKLSTSGSVIATYPMTNNYWFPALPVFPDNYAPVISESVPNSIAVTQEGYKLFLGDLVTDKDNLDASIIKSVEVEGSTGIIEARVWADTLYIDAVSAGNVTLTLKCNSNGKIVTKKIAVSADNTTAIEENVNNAKVSIYPNPFTEYIIIDSDKEDTAIVCSLMGARLKTIKLSQGENRVELSNLTNGIYTIQIGNKLHKVIKR